MFSVFCVSGVLENTDVFLEGIFPVCWSFPWRWEFPPCSGSWCLEKELWCFSPAGLCSVAGPLCVGLQSSGCVWSRFWRGHVVRRPLPVCFGFQHQSAEQELLCFPTARTLHQNPHRYCVVVLISAGPSWVFLCFSFRPGLNWDKNLTIQFSLIQFTLVQFRPIHFNWGQFG